jgi:hypothetical protein
MDLNFFFSLLHCHFKLILLIFKRINMVSSSVETLLDFLDLKLHDVMLYKNILLFFGDLTQSLDSHIVFQRQFFDLRRESLVRSFHFN